MRLVHNIKDRVDMDNSQGTDSKEDIISKEGRSTNSRADMVVAMDKVAMDSKGGTIGMIGGWGVGVVVWLLCWVFLLRVVVWMLVCFSNCLLFELDTEGRKRD